MQYKVMQKRESSMTSLDMPHLKMAVAEPADMVASADLTAQIWVTFLEIFLEIYSAAVVVEERIMVQ